MATVRVIIKCRSCESIPDISYKGTLWDYIDFVKEMYNPSSINWCSSCESHAVFDLISIEELEE